MLKLELPSDKLEAGIFVASKLKDSMKHSFKHGKMRGETTHLEGVDPHFSWKKGEVTGITGWPQHGKTEFTYYLMLMKAIFKGWKWAIYSPENMSVDHEDKVSAGEIFDTLIHSLFGKSTDPDYPNQMSEEEYDRGIRIVSEHFFVVYPEEEHTPENINKYLVHLKRKYKVDGWLKDPWNSLDYEIGSREDLFLKRALSIENKLAKQNKVCNVITIHPSGKPNLDQDNNIISPDQYDISGGTMWNNKLDNLLSVNRPFHKKDPSDTTVEFHSKKIKKQKLVGIPGMVEMSFTRKENRFYINGLSPLDKIHEKGVNEFPETEAPF